jgi:HAD superfamily hydrolase (TIGR01509 family)
MIKAVIIDFDGVVYLENMRFSKLLNSRFNIPDEKVMSFFRDELIRCQLGQADLKKELVKYIKTWQIKSTVEKLMEMWFENGKINDKLVSIISELRTRGIVCVLVTDNEKYRMNYMMEKYNLEKIFDKIVTSYDIGARKPNRKVYDFIFSSLNLKPRECLYFDDSEKNIEIGKKLGIKSYVFENNNEVRKIIDKLEKRIESKAKE